MITEKSKNILRRAVAWLMVWKGYADEDKKNGTRTNMDSYAAENVFRLAKEQIDRLDTEKRQIEESLDGRR